MKTTLTQLPASPTLTALASGDHRVQSYAMTSGEQATMATTNRLPSTVGGVATGAAYDPQGNLTGIYGTPGSSATQLTMTYDSLGRVATLGDTANATSQAYGYDDEGLRIKITDSATGLTKYNIYDESRHLETMKRIWIDGSGKIVGSNFFVSVDGKAAATVTGYSSSQVFNSMSPEAQKLVLATSSAILNRRTTSEGQVWPSWLRKGSNGISDRPGLGFLAGAARGEISNGLSGVQAISGNSKYDPTPLVWGFIP